VASNIEINGLSLYRHAIFSQQPSGAVIPEMPERLRYVYRDDTRLHVAADGEYLFDIAYAYYRHAFGDDAHDLWEILAQFQPVPIEDPSIALAAGTHVLIPSVAFIREEALGSSLTEFPEL